MDKKQTEQFWNTGHHPITMERSKQSTMQFHNKINNEAARVKKISE